MRKLALGQPSGMGMEAIVRWLRDCMTKIEEASYVPDIPKAASFTVANAPSALRAGEGAMIYVSDETGGGVIAFSDGSDWRRVTDRQVIS